VTSNVLYTLDGASKRMRTYRLLVTYYVILVDFLKNRKIQFFPDKVSIYGIKNTYMEKFLLHHYVIILILIFAIQTSKVKTS